MPYWQSWWKRKLASLVVNNDLARNRNPGRPRQRHRIKGPSLLGLQSRALDLRFAAGHMFGIRRSRCAGSRNDGFVQLAADRSLTVWRFTLVVVNAKNCARANKNAAFPCP